MWPHPTAALARRVHRLPSHVLLAMGRTVEEAESTIRFSLGYATTKGDIEHAVEAVTRAVREVRGVLGLTRSSNL